MYFLRPGLNPGPLKARTNLMLLSQDSTHAPIHLQSTLRVKTPEETLAWLNTKKKQLGITRVAHVTGLDNIGIPVSVCIRPLSKHLTTSQGKGATQMLADISAIMESIESYHMENPPKPEFHGNYTELTQDHQIIAPTDFSPGFFIKKNLNDHPLDWIKANDLIYNETCYIPQALTRIDTSSTFPEAGFFQITSKGMGAGNTIEEALCHSILELLEREAISKWQSSSTEIKKQSQIDPKSIENSYVTELLRKLKKAQSSCYIFNLSQLPGIYTFACIVGSEDPLRQVGFFSGYGAHFDQYIALSRAITEAVQSRLTYINGTRDDIFPETYLTQKHLNTLPFTVTNPSQTLLTQQPASYPNCFNAYLKYLIDRVKTDKKARLYWVNHTKDKINIPVVQAFITRVQHHA